MFLKIDGGLVALAIILAFTVPNLGPHGFEALKRSLGKLAQRRRPSVIVAQLTTLLLRLVLLPILPIPTPAACL